MDTFKNIIVAVCTVITAIIGVVLVLSEIDNAQPLIVLIGLKVVGFVLLVLSYEGTKNLYHTK